MATAPDSVTTFPRIRSSFAALLIGLAPVPAMAAEPVITTVAGGCVWGGTIVCDGEYATDVSLTWPLGVAADPWGNFHIALQHDGVYRVDAGGRISKLAGNTTNYNGDGIPAIEAGINAVAIAIDSAGIIYVADKSNARIRMITRDGIIRTVAGNGTTGFAGDGGLAVNAALNNPDGIAVDADGNLYILDRGNHRVRKVSNGVITTLAGNGVPGFTGDHGPARMAQLNNPQGIAVDSSGNVHVADTGNNRIRRISTDGTIRTIAGGGPFHVDPIATNMSLQQPTSVTVDPIGNVLFSTRAAVHRIEPDGTRSTVAGQFDNIRGLITPWGPGIDQDYGDGGPAIAAYLGSIEAIAFDHAGNLLVADQGTARIRKVTPIPWKPAIKGLGAFSAGHRIPLVGWFKDIKIADMNGDGRDDVVATTRMGRFSYNPDTDLRVHILLQRADGTLDAPRTVRYGLQQGQGHDGGMLAIADFNRDGVLDAAVSRSSGVDIVPGSRSGNFTSRAYHDLPVPGSMDEIIATDFNRDGLPDIVGPSVQFGARLVHIIGSGSSSAGTASFSESIPDSVRLLHAADFNGDGNEDLAYAYRAAGGYDYGIAIRFHDGRTMFSSPTRFTLSPLQAPLALSVGDIDGDGRKDLLFDYPVDHRMPNLTRLGVMLQTPAGGLQLLEPIPTYHGARSLAIGDVDRDGHADLVAFRADSGVSLLRGNGSGAFGIEIKRFIPDLVPEESPVMAMGDINQDGLPDVVVTVPGIGLDILYGTSRPAQRRSGDGPLSRPDPARSSVAAPPNARLAAMPSRASAPTSRPLPARISVAATAGAGSWPSLKRKYRAIALRWTSWRLHLYRDGLPTLFNRTMQVEPRSSSSGKDGTSWTGNDARVPRECADRDRREHAGTCP